MMSLKFWMVDLTEHPNSHISIFGYVSGDDSSGETCKTMEFV